MLEAIHVIIEGKVQKVGYRDWAINTASELGITGWVRNKRDGTVEALFYGETTQIRKMIEYCYQGPSRASVSEIHITPLEPLPKTIPPDFIQLPTHS